MFGVSYDTWKNVCNMYFTLSSGSQKAYLQWFPFFKLTSADKKKISGEDFYNKYIKTASFVFFPNAMHQSENFLQKGDGSFRDSSLVSPILFLFLQSVGLEIYKQYLPIRPSEISVYYAGNYGRLRPKYKQDYDEFFKELNASIDEYQYFIKTDITNFFSNININYLINQIDKVCNSEVSVFTQTQLHLFRELLVYCGNGTFPLIENSIASSFLATVVYLDDVDKELFDFISKNVPEFSSFRIVRYVDDMYILISSDQPLNRLHNSYNVIRNEYSSILKKVGLALNASKCCFKETVAINQELKKSLYDEYFNGEKHNIEELFSGSLCRFIKKLSEELVFDSIDIERYNTLVYDSFSSDDIEFTPSEVFNFFVYEEDTELKSEAVANELVGLVKRSISFISLDPRRLTTMIMKTQDSRAIKALLSKLFDRNRSGQWNSYDTSIAISYLLQSNFRHIDLLEVLSVRHSDLSQYYSHNCRSSTIHCLDAQDINKLVEVIAHDEKAHYLYFMYLCEMKRFNYMAAFAYYKNFFDRATADMHFMTADDPSLKTPNYKRFYKEKALIDFYSCISDSKRVIQAAHKFRNSNPLSHSSSELLDSNETSCDLCSSINELSVLMLEFGSSHIKSVRSSMSCGGSIYT